MSWELEIHTGGGYQITKHDDPTLDKEIWRVAKLIVDIEYGRYDPKPEPEKCKHGATILHQQAEWCRRCGAFRLGKEWCLPFKDPKS